MTARTLTIDPPLCRDETGTIRIGKTRITLDVLLEDHFAGMAPTEMVQQMPTLTLADVHGALAYYYSHQVEVDEYLRRGQEQADAFQKKMEAVNADQIARMKERIEALRAKRDGNASPAQ